MKKNKKALSLDKSVVTKLTVHKQALIIGGKVAFAPPTTMTSDQCPTKQ